MAVDVFGGRVDHQIGAQGDGLLQGRRQEGVVHRRPAADRVGPGAEVGHVNYPHQRVRRGLDQDQFRPQGEGGVQGGPVVLVDELHVEMAAPGPRAEQAVGAAVEVVRGDQQVAGLQ
jgi:hypothetical protein